MPSSSAIRSTPASSTYDLFFRPTGSGIFELRSFLGPGAFVLAQLKTAMQDMWHEGSDTWFDRSTDLRVLLNGGGAAPLAYGPNGAPGAHREHHACGVGERLGQLARPPGQRERECLWQD